MCKQCLLQLSRAFAFKQQVETAQENLRQYCTQGFTDDTLMKPIFSEDFLYFKTLTPKIYTITTVKSPVNDNLVLPEDNESHFNDVLELVNNESNQQDFQQEDDILEDTKNEYLETISNEPNEQIQDSEGQDNFQDDKIEPSEEISFPIVAKKQRAKLKNTDGQEHIFTDTVTESSQAIEDINNIDQNCQKYVCMYCKTCLKEFPNQRSLEKHISKCDSNKKIKSKVNEKIEKKIF